mgnify:CR=1 FL=1
MVVVLIIAIVLAIAIPTFLGARERANDRAAQSDLRNAHTNELVWFADNRSGEPFTDDPSKLVQLDASLDWTDDPDDLEDVEGSIYVDLTTVNGQPAVVVATKSRPGTCFWLRAVANEDHPRFAENDCTIPADLNLLAFLPAWD